MNFLVQDIYFWNKRMKENCLDVKEVLYEPRVYKFAVDQMRIPEQGVFNL